MNKTFEGYIWCYNSLRSLLIFPKKNLTYKLLLKLFNAICRVDFLSCSCFPEILSTFLQTVIDLRQMEFQSFNISNNMQVAVESSLFSQSMCYFPQMCNIELLFKCLEITLQMYIVALM